jgi:hypothetical protein
MILLSGLSSVQESRMFGSYLWRERYSSSLYRPFQSFNRESARSLPGFLDVQYSFVRLPPMAGMRGGPPVVLLAFWSVYCVYRLFYRTLFFLNEIVY